MPNPHKDTLFPKGYWERPANEKRGDPSAAQIYQAVGAALTAWELAEESLADLFLVMSQCTDANAYNAIRRAFGSIESSAGRRKALEAVAPIYFAPYWPHELIKRALNQVMNAFERASARRDDIAHGIGITFRVDDEDLGAFLIPAAYSSSRNKPFPEIIETDKMSFEKGYYRYTSEQISTFAQRFSELKRKTMHYTQFITKNDHGISQQIIQIRSAPPHS
jgi:hypothetical protein